MKKHFVVSRHLGHKMLWMISQMQPPQPRHAVIRGARWTKSECLLIPQPMNLGTWLFTKLRGRQVGTDAAGNIYYQERKPRPGGGRPRRWVAYAGPPEASVVPPEWHAWLHYTTDAPLPTDARRPWQKPHIPNVTGTELSYRPPGHDYRGGQRDRATGDYEAWTPGS